MKMYDQIYILKLLKMLKYQMSVIIALLKTNAKEEFMIEEFYGMGL